MNKEKKMLVLTKKKRKSRENVKMAVVNAKKVMRESFKRKV
jgi:hypothetical protein